MSTETNVWISAHYEEPFHRLRTAKLPAKLARLGVLDLDRKAYVLDACCGQGEALAALRQHGFRHLAGADRLTHREWEQIADCCFTSCDVRRTPFADGELDAVMMLHALHHMGGARGVADVLSECFRVLKPTGKLFIIDFPSSPQIRTLFWLLRKRIGVVTPGLLNFARILDEEWSYLSVYLDEWTAVRALLTDGPFQVQHWRRGLFLYYLALSKPEHTVTYGAGTR